MGSVPGLPELSPGRNGAWTVLPPISAASTRRKEARGGGYLAPSSAYSSEDGLQGSS